MNKKPGMYLLILWLWLLSVLYFDFRLLSLLIGAESIIAKLSVILFILCLNILWFYGIYHIVVPIYSILERKRCKRDITPSVYQPPVAVLYTTKDDFQIRAIESCIRQDYPNYHVFICDDSNDSNFINQIDNFKREHKDIVTIIRRKSTKGYKAGNINYTLKQIHNRYPYFAINDADGVLPPNFISGLMPYFERDNRIAFVQAQQKANPVQHSQFSQDLSPTIDIHWDYYVPAKERYGFTMFYGHGAIIKTDAWEMLGGLPEIATEDLSFSMRIREYGYYGIFAPEVVCYEEFPPSFTRFRRRNEKWVKGTTECLFKDYPRFLFNPKVSWVEKIDVFISAFSLLVAVPFALFLLVVSILLPMFFNLFKFNGPLIITPVYAANSWVTYFLSIQYNVFWTWDLLWIMVLMIFGPQTASFISLYKTPKKMFRYMALSTFLYLSIIAVSNINFFTYLFTRKAYFPVTGEVKGYRADNSGIISIIELCIGIGLLIYTFCNMNVWLFSTGLTLIISPLIKRLYWGTRIVRQVLYLPFIVTVCIIILITYSLIMYG